MPGLTKSNVCLLLALSLAPAAIAQENFTVKLITPLSAAGNKKGDAVRAAIVAPPSFQGDTLQGQVTETKASRGQSVLQFNLVSLLHQGVLVPVSTTITSIANSQGQPGVDDQGQPLAASNPAPAESQTRSRLGSGLGGMLGGNVGGAVSNSANAPPRAPAANIRVVSQGAALELAAGVTLGLTMVSTGRQSLSSLAPNPPSANPPVAMPPGGAPPAYGGGGAASAYGGAGVPAGSNAPTETGAPMAGAMPSGSMSAGGAAGGQPELKSPKIEFVPGERTIFFDDFSDMVPDEPPPHWKVRDGRVDLRMGGNVRELYAGESGDAAHLTSPKFDVPQNFTFELSWTGQGQMDFSFRDKDGNEAIHCMVRGEPDGNTANTSIDAKEHLGQGGIQTSTAVPVNFALWAQQGRVRAYMNGERLVDVNQVEFAPIVGLEFSMGGYRPNGVRSLRIAESAPDFSTTINSFGKYVTHGINFDTDSDRLKPDSGGVLKQVSAGLIRNPNLKLEIDGYTDSVGDAAHNLDLSRRRADAVRAVLISQFGVDGSRLTSSGFGSANPLGSNDTPDGRAENRRVEFVKQ